MIARYIIALFLVLVSAGAHAQTCPATNSTPGIASGGNVFGRVASQWNAYFGAKVDVNNGILCNPTIIPPPTGLGTVTGVTFTGDGTVLSSTPSAVISGAGTLTGVLNVQVPNVVLVGPASGGSAPPTFRALAAADLTGKIACSDLTNDGSACAANTGTSGTALPFLDGANTWSGNQTFNSGFGIGIAPQAGSVLSVKGLTSDASANVASLYDSSNRRIFRFGNDARLDISKYSTDGALIALGVEPTTPANNQRAGHYAFTALNSLSEQHTIGMLASNITDITNTSMDSSITLMYMDNVNGNPAGTYTYQQPNKTVLISSAGLSLPTIPIAGATNLTMSGTLLSGSASSFNGPGGFARTNQFYTSIGTQFGRHSADTSGSGTVCTKSRNATVGSHTALVSGDGMCTTQSAGSDGTAYITATQVLSTVDGAVSTGIVPGRMTWWTMNAAGTLGERMRLSASGGFYIGAGQIDPGATNFRVAGTAAVDGAITAPGLASGSGATTGTLCWTTGTGSITVNTTVACLSSDERLKDIIGPDSEAKSRLALMGLKPIVYRWKPGTPKAEADPGEHLGLGAFATGYVDERLIGRDTEGNPSGWRQDAMIALLVANAQEQRTDSDRQGLYIIFLVVWCGVLSVMVVVLFYRERAAKVRV